MTTQTLTQTPARTCGTCGETFDSILGETDCQGCQQASAGITQDDGLAGTALQLALTASILKLLPVDARTREMRLMDEAEEAWIINRLAELDAETGPPPF